MHQLTRDDCLAIRRYTGRVITAIKEYAAHPTACADWCPKCVYPVGSTKECANCKAVRAMRKRRTT